MEIGGESVTGGGVGISLLRPRVIDAGDGVGEDAAQGARHGHHEDHGDHEDHGRRPWRRPGDDPGSARRRRGAAEGWYAVELPTSGERLIPLLGWALLDRYFPPYRNGNESPLLTTETVRGLIAPAGRAVRIVDELSALTGGYRRA